MATINAEKVRLFAEKLKSDGNVASALDFYHTFDGKAHDAAMYPALNDPEAINFFFFACLHQYGFWYADDVYRGPMYATFDGKRVKGSDAIWVSLTRAWRKHSWSLHTDQLPYMTEHELFDRVFVDDEGPLRFPDPVTRLRLTKDYGRWLQRKGMGPAAIVTAANNAAQPLQAFLDVMSMAPGFYDYFRGDRRADEDSTCLRFEKKSRLLAMTLMQRPEKYLRPAPNEALGPIVDYHLMRVALRLGLVDLNEDERESNVRRSHLQGRAADEDEIRYSVHEALVEVLRLSGVTPETLDFALWSARRYCPEMEEPNCGKCRFESVCAKRTELFQPVFRTTAY